MGKSPSIIKESLDRLDEHMAIGASRYAMKQAYRKAHPEAPGWTITDNKIHSYSTRNTYQQQTLQFVTWARTNEGIYHLKQLDARRGELVGKYLQQGIDQGKSPWTLQTQRAALRSFFADRTLGADITMPQRHREDITRSRRVVARDNNVSVDGNKDLIEFLRGTGLRRSEIRDLQIKDIFTRRGQMSIHVKSGKGGKSRDVPVLRGHEQAITTVVETRTQKIKVFERIPDHLDVHALRREYAQELYQQVSGRELPPTQRRITEDDYDKRAVMFVSRALGHNRLDIVLNHYLR